MPHLTIRPILGAQSVSDLTDAITTAAKSDAGDIGIDIGNGSAILAVQHGQDGGPSRITVSLSGSTDSRVAARVNRLLDGLNAPKVETYHRTGTIMVRLPGAPAPVPCTFKGAYSGARWAWTLVSAPVAPSAPVQTPTSPPAAPSIAPQAAPKVGGIKVAPQAATDSRRLFRVPPRSTTHKVVVKSKSDREVLDTAWDLHRDGVSLAVMLEGPAGTGKTSIVDDLAADKGVGVFVFDGAAAASWADWTGTTVLRDGEKGTTTHFAWSSFIEAIRSDGPYGDQPRIVLVDEVNRAESAAANNALMPILSQGRLYVPEADETVEVSKAVLFVFTMNRGYAGTTALDIALQDRMWVTVRLDYLSEDDEVALVLSRVAGLSDEKVRPLVRAAHQVRAVAERGEIETGVSTRSVLQAAHFVAKGLGLRTAATYCWANAFAANGGDDSERGVVVTAINSVLVD